MFEARFLDAMYGFRPNRGCHEALKALNWVIEKNRINWVIDADISGFFDGISHDKLMKCVEMRIKDPNVLWLIRKFLKAGLTEKGEYRDTEEGTIQGSNLSPVLSNVYMHYMLVLWFYKEVRPKMTGQSFLVAYADDFVCCVQNKWEAEKFYEMLKERLNTFGLELEESKSRMIEFGRFAQENTKGRKPDTFDFLGFTHYCGKSQKGRFRVKRKTSRKKFREKIRNFKEWIKQNRNMPLKELTPKVKSKLNGHYNYYGITDNFPMMNQYFHTVTYLIFKWLNRRSQKRSYTTQGFNEMLKHYPLPLPSIRVNIYES